MARLKEPAEKNWHLKKMHAEECPFSKIHREPLRPMVKCFSHLK